MSVTKTTDGKFTKGLKAVGAVPATSEDVETSECSLWQVTFINTATAETTVSIYDKDSTPLILATAKLVASAAGVGGGMAVVSWPEGQPAVGGFSWIASATGVKAFVKYGKKI